MEDVWRLLIFLEWILLCFLATGDFEMSSLQGRNFHLWGKKKKQTGMKSDQILFLFHLLVSRKTQKEGQ